MKKESGKIPKDTIRCKHRYTVAAPSGSDLGNYYATLRNCCAKRRGSYVHLYIDDIAVCVDCGYREEWDEESD